MINKKEDFNRGKSFFLLAIFILLVLGTLFLTSDNTRAAGEISYCCERTIDGVWCQNVNDASECRTGSGLNVPVATSCESTAYCSIGTCINRLEGTCSDSPQGSCESNGGTWDLRNQDEIPQCQLGCCLIGDQAAFVTQANCNRQSSLYNLDINFKKDIKNQGQCLALAFPRARGACVFDDGITRNCEMITKGECNTKEESSSSGITIEFHQGLLCSAESLETICGPSERTACVADKDEVYFLDVCGNLANIYDASKARDTNYWTEIVEKGDSCGIDSVNGNANSKICGNCDYLSGSTCKAYERGNTATVEPDIGNYVCADLSCEYQGEKYKHGESWCATSKGFSNSAPGSESYRMVCYNGEVTIEECASFREKVCLEEDITDDFTTASCVVNRFRDCFMQDNKEDCGDEERRDCTWLVGETNNFFRDDSNYNNKYVVDDDNALVEPETNDDGKLDDSDGGVGASCIPNDAPGFKFWEDENRTICQIADDFCLVKYEKRILGGWNCKENCWCIENEEGDVNENWLTNRRELCTSFGDCGISNNWLGFSSGFEAGDDIVFNECETNEETGQIEC